MTDEHQTLSARNGALALRDAQRNMQFVQDEFCQALRDAGVQETGSIVRELLALLDARDALNAVVRAS